MEVLIWRFKEILIDKKEKDLLNRKIDDSFKKIVVTKDIVLPHYDEYDILTVNIYDFLLNPHILEQ